MYQYVLFDLDGTLIDPKEGITKSAQYGLHAVGVEETDLEKLAVMIGPPLVASFMQYYDIDYDTAVKCRLAYQERFGKVGVYEQKLYPGIADLLRELKAHGIKTALATSKPEVYAVAICEHDGIADLLTEICGTRIHDHGATKTEVICSAMERLGVPENEKDQVVMVGDRKFDVIGAREAGVDCIAVTYGYATEGELEEVNPPVWAHSVEELKAMLLS